MSTKVRGLNRVLGNLKKFSKASQSAVKFALADETDIIFAVSLPLVPVDEGILRSTGRVKSIGTRDEPAFEIRYGGGPSTSYTIRQHEDLTLMHTSPQQAKFLEQPFNERVPGLVNRVAKRVEAAI